MHLKWCIFVLIYWNLSLVSSLSVSDGNIQPDCRPCVLRRRSAAARLLGSQVRIPLNTWMLVSCVVRCVINGLFDELITCAEESYRVRVCLTIVTWKPRQWGSLGLLRHRKKIYICLLDNHKDNFTFIHCFIILPNFKPDTMVYSCFYCTVITQLNVSSS
jgi:hypothetical protein